jgi:acylphosphatase
MKSANGAPAPLIRYRVIVRGQVQGVGFRASCAHRARDAGLAGSVRNLGGGGVEAVFEGPTHAVEQLVAWCRTGPAMARVQDLQIYREAPTGATDFQVTV